MNDSTFGSAAPKNRSINVGANLLGEWTAEQRRLRREVGLCAAAIGGSLLVALVTMPILLQGAAEGEARNAASRKQAASFDAALALAERDRKAAQPALVIADLRGRTSASFDRFLGEFDRILCAGNSRTAIASIKIEVAAAEVHATVQADAEEDGAADAFAHNAAEAGAKIDAITSSRPGVALGTQGMGFTYEKRIGVTP